MRDFMKMLLTLIGSSILLFTVTCYGLKPDGCDKTVFELFRESLTEETMAKEVATEDVTEKEPEVDEAGIKLGVLKALKLPASKEDLNASGFYEWDGVYSHDELEISKIEWSKDKAIAVTFTDPFVMSVLNVPGMPGTNDPYELAACNNTEYENGIVTFDYNGHNYYFVFADKEFKLLRVSTSFTEE